jgi:hypothetical protein
MLVTIKEYFGNLMGPNLTVKLNGRVSMEEDPLGFFNLFTKAIQASQSGKNQLTIDPNRWIRRINRRFFHKNYFQNVSCSDFRA